MQFSPLMTVEIILWKSLITIPSDKNIRTFNIFPEWKVLLTTYARTKLLFFTHVTYNSSLVSPAVFSKIRIFHQKRLILALLLIVQMQLSFRLNRFVTNFLSQGFTLNCLTGKPERWKNSEHYYSKKLAFSMEYLCKNKR